MAKERLDLTGQRFGKLVVIEFGEMRKCHSYWLCKCDCGNSFVTQGTSLKTGNTKSCGCIKKERIIAISTSHGKRNTDTYKTWADMLQRCNNIKNKHYKDYGKRGISVCDEWRTFEGFYKDMGDRPKGMTIDRKNVDNSYCKDNCQWSTQTEQANNRRSNIFITYNNKTQTLTQWCKELKHSYSLMRYRIVDLNWDAERAFTTKRRNEK